MIKTDKINKINCCKQGEVWLSILVCIIVMLGWFAYHSYVNSWFDYLILILIIFILIVYVKLNAIKVMRFELASGAILNCIFADDIAMEMAYEKIIQCIEKNKEVDQQSIIDKVFDNMEGNL